MCATRQRLASARRGLRKRSGKVQKTNYIIHGDSRNALSEIEDKCVDCVVTSPPYFGLRDYKESEQIGLEETPTKYVEDIVEVFRQVRRVLKDDGTVWLNVGDSYAKKDYEADGIKKKDLIGIPWMIAFALRKDGWYLRSDIIWHKNAMPESVKDRCTKTHEYIFMLAKQPTYYFDQEAILEEAAYDGRKETMNHGSTKYGDDVNAFASNGHQRWRTKNMAKNDGISTPNSFHVNRENGGKDPVYFVRNKRSVWKVATSGLKDAHFAPFPERLITPCVLAGSRAGGIVLDPFMGSGTTAVVASANGRKWIGCELNADYIELALNRINRECGLLAGV